MPDQPNQPSIQLLLERTDVENVILTGGGNVWVDLTDGRRERAHLSTDYEDGTPDA